MAVSAEFRDFVLEQLRAVAPVSSKSMFGGIGLYSQGLFFALMDDDVVYFKVDDANRSDYETAGARRFAPYGDDQYSMNYYELPADVLEDEEQLRVWMKKSLDVARRKKKK